MVRARVRVAQPARSSSEDGTNHRDYIGESDYLQSAAEAPVYRCVVVLHLFAF